MSDQGNRDTILVIGNTTGDIDVLYDTLKINFNIVAEKNVKEAVSVAIKHKPDLIMICVPSPDTSGFDVIVALKNTDQTKRVPIVFITEWNEPEDEERAFLHVAADYISKPYNVPVVKARLNAHIRIGKDMKAIERLSNIDTLTNLPNRRYFNEYSAKEWARGVREQKPVSLCMMDIDNFKIYNDTYGHPQGDFVLQTAALVFSETVYRATDFIARWGGEEFVVLLPNTDLKGAEAVAERVRANVEKAEIPLPNGDITRITISIGVNSVQPKFGMDMAEFIAQADNALYRAKRLGRNRVAVSDET
jgi:diguanylate cyclase (GGDEF)-like protein